MKILVTGAAGYIGSVVTEYLVDQDYTVLALDNLQAGHRAAVHPDAAFVHGELLDRPWLFSLLREHRVEAVVHLAAEALVGESVHHPDKFFRANVTAGLNLLDAMVSSGVKGLVFSSTAAVYGEPNHIPISEDARCAPINSYGESKLAFERILPWYHAAYDLRYICLRYFNACGATERYGEHHVPETHLIPILVDVALGWREEFHLYGTDYDTPDGTCIRDYIHVADIARAHVLALDILDEAKARVYNLANGSGYSNREAIEAVKKVTGKDIKVVPAARRPGDPARLVATSDLVRRELDWEPLFPELTAMVETAWAWRLKHPRGYDRLAARGQTG